ncbi:MAG: NnrS family protein [Alphaproteobacteria bacterium]|nr:NnrS family protein [Alphaproteobacteria bacterium]MBM3641131.1 NnrS family protein [Alphaproteobacteria bacterium]
MARRADRHLLFHLDRGDRRFRARSRLPGRFPFCRHAGNRRRRELAKSADCRCSPAVLGRQSPHPFRIDCDHRDGAIGARLGVATLLLLVALIGGRITPSFTRNWLAKQRPDGAMPASFDFLDRAALAATALACAIWVAAPEGMLAPWLELVAGVTLGLRLARWRDQATLREPLLWVLHLGYGWLSFGFLLLALSGLNPALPQSAALHALTVGAIGTMTLAVMTRASLGHTGCPLTAGPGTTTIYALVTLATVLRLAASIDGSGYIVFLSLAAAAGSGAFGLFALLYAKPFMAPRVKDETARPI